MVEDGRGMSETAGGPAEPVQGGSAVEVAEVLRLVLQPHARVLAGRAGMQRRVGWVTTLRGLPPVFESSGGDEVVLAPVATLEALRALSVDYDLSKIIVSLQATGVAAVVVVSREAWECPDDVRNCGWGCPRSAVVPRRDTARGGGTGAHHCAARR